MQSGWEAGLSTTVAGVVEALGGGRTVALAVVAGALGVVAGLAGRAALARVRPSLSGSRATAGAAFVDALADHDRVAVLTHPNPDPDALAAGMAVRTLAESVGVEAALQYPGEIRHQENRAFRRVLDVDCRQVTHVSDLAAEAVVLVDHSEPRGFAGADGVLPHAVVDHHPDRGDGVAGRGFTDVRPAYGATATVVAEYLRDVGARPASPDGVDADADADADADLVVPSRVATALLFAILSDTDRLTSGAVAADFEAAGYLRPGIDETRLERVGNPQVSAEVMETRARALAEREVRAAFAVSFVPDAAHADAVPQAADELVRLEGVTAAVVCGVVDDRVFVSGRSRDERVHMGRVLDAVVAGYDDGGGGGHARMGGGQIAADEVVPSVLVERLFDGLAGAERALDDEVPGPAEVDDADAEGDPDEPAPTGDDGFDSDSGSDFDFDVVDEPATAGTPAVDVDPAGAGVDPEPAPVADPDPEPEPEPATVEADPDRDAPVG